MTPKQRKKIAKRILAFLSKIGSVIITTSISTVIIKIITIVLS